MLIAARLVQRAGAALMTPASLALISEAYPQPAEKARAIGFWAMGGAVASAAGPLVGGALTVINWRFIFLITLPVGAIALWLLAGVPRSQRAALIGHVSGSEALRFGIFSFAEQPPDFWQHLIGFGPVGIGFRLARPHRDVIELKALLFKAAKNHSA